MCAMHSKFKTTTPGTGTMSLENYDLGIVTTIGGALKESCSVQRYYINIDGVDDDILITYENPEQVFVRKEFPAIIIKRSNITKALNRMNAGHVSWIESGAVAKEFVDAEGRTGYTEYRELKESWPFDLNYDLNIQTRTAYEADLILQKLMRIYKPQSLVNVLDSAGDARTYDVSADDPSDLEEVNDINDRMMGYTLPIIVYGELDLNDPTTWKSVQSIVTTMEQV